MPSQYVTAPGVVDVGPGDVDQAGDVVLEVALDAAATCSITPRARVAVLVAPPSSAVSSASPAVAYVNATTDATVAGSTPITAAGLYRIRASGLRVALDVALTGTGVTLAWRFVAGRT